MRLIKHACLIFVVSQVNLAYSQDYFNPMFLGKDAASLEELSYLAEGNSLSPGEYYLDVYLGDQLLQNAKIKFYSEKESKTVVPCITKGIIESIPFSQVTLNDLKFKTVTDGQCVDIKRIIPEFDFKVDTSRSALVLSIPQIYLQSILSTLANQKDWDDGITAYLLNYQYSGSNSKNKNSNNFSSNYLNLQNRINIGPWRLNGNVYWNQNKYGSKSSTETKTNNVYVSRDIRSLRSTLQIGQSTLGSQLFDSIPFIGASLATSNEMLPDSERGYSPPIRGIVDSRSKITIRQNNSIIYQTYVDPGPYDISDLNPVGTSGDYFVEVTSADGRVTSYTVPYSTLPNLLKLGNYNYSLAIGQLDITSAERRKFVQGGVSIGLPLETTFYTGLQLSSDYKSVGAGLGRDFGSFGALSIDATAADADLTGGFGNKKGQTYRILYAKNFIDTGTNIQLTGYRYSTDGYYTLSESSYKRNRKNSYDPYTGQFVDYTLSGRKKNSFQVNISQNIGDYGQLFVWGNTTSYWNSTKSKSMQLGWNKTFNQLNNLSVSVNYNKYTYSGTKNDTIFVSFSMPLGGRTSDYRMYLTNSTTYNTETYDYTNNTSLSGTALDNRVDYNAYQTVNKESNQNVTNLSASYKADVAMVNLGVNYSSRTTQFDYGVSGSVLLHDEGIVFSREAADTAILIKADGATGTKVPLSENVVIGKDGYALVPYATPYHYNDIELDPATFDDDFDVESKVKKVAPTRGAISKVVFDVRKGYNFLVNVIHKGQSIRFGTVVTSLSDKASFIANDDGTVYLTGVQDHGKYTVNWDKGTNCSFVIDYGDNFNSKVINKINVNCL